jgi:2-polyprenyl-6-hydroxyphenyl methylase/3-demethylubiquinone-9 3-methyltransferase
MPATAHQELRHADEVDRGERFEFGKNWQAFLDVLDEERIADAERSLQQMLGVDSLSGRSFLDAGSGSGLFSLAARRLGAERVRSFDFDPSSVACTRELRRRYFPDDPAWEVEEASVLDEDFVRGLGRWDVVYSWGVLHHTGAMWRALDHVQSAVSDDGLLFLSIYNDQGYKSRLWRLVKRTYNRLPGSLRPLWTAAVMGPYLLLDFAKTAAGGGAIRFLRSWTDDRGGERGMSRWHDLTDWVGGYPFEVAKPEQVFDFLRDRGFVLQRLFTAGGGLGCNEYVFRRSASPGM